MLHYKYIHKNDGYEHKFSTNDEDIQFEIKSYIEGLRFISSKQNEPVYAYICDEKQSIYYKESNTIITALFDTNKELDKLTNAYSQELLFNESLMIIDNSQSDITDKPARPLSFSLPNLMPNDLKYVPAIVDNILSGQRVAIVGRNVDHIKNFVKFVLYLFPTSFSNKIGYIVNPQVIPNVYEYVFNSVKIVALTDPNQNFDEFNLVVNLAKPFEDVYSLGDYAKCLSFNSNNIMNLYRKSKELHSLFDSNGFNNLKASKLLAPFIFEVEKTKDTAERLLEALCDYNSVDIRLFNGVAEFVLENDLYEGSIATNVDLIISKNHQLEDYAILFKEKLILGYVQNVRLLSDKEIDEVIQYFADENIIIGDEVKALLENQKDEPKLYQILFEISNRVADEDKRSYIAEVLSVDRTYNLKINNRNFNEYIMDKIYGYEYCYQVELFSRFIYSTILGDNIEKNYSRIRKNDFIKKFLGQRKEVSDVRLIFHVYKRIKEILESNNPEAFIEYHDYELFTDEQLDSIVKISAKNEANAYFESVKFISEFDGSFYAKLQRKYIELVLGKDSKEIPYYKKYINVHNLNIFEDFFTINNEEKPKDIEVFIKGLQDEKETSEVLETYRLDFIYNMYLSSPLMIRQKIEKKIGIQEGTKPKEKVKEIVYNEEGRNDSKKLSLQKSAIDTIINYSRSDDAITSSGQSTSLLRTLLVVAIAALVALIGLVILSAPAIMKVAMLNKDFFDAFFQTGNIFLPYAFFLIFILFLVEYKINIKKTRGNLAQAIFRAILYTALLSYIPCLFYSVGYIVVYFVL